MFLRRCTGNEPLLTADDYEKHMTELMEEIHNNIPRVFVNYILIYNVSEVIINIMSHSYVYNVCIANIAVLL